MTDAKLKKLWIIDMFEHGYQIRGWCRNKFNDLVYIAPNGRSLIWKQREIEQETTTIEIPKTFQCFKALMKGNLKCHMFS